MYDEEVESWGREFRAKGHDPVLDKDGSILNETQPEWIEGDDGEEGFIVEGYHPYVTCNHCREVYCWMCTEAKDILPCKKDVL
jgi:hypothetical protein